MSPPAVICMVVWPLVMIETEIIVIRAVLVHVCALGISLGIFIDALPIEPLVERTTVIEYAVQNNSHASSVCLFHHLGKEFVGSLQVRFVRHTVDVFGRKTVFALVVTKKFPFVIHNFADMGIDVIVILNIVFVVGR